MEIRRAVREDMNGINALLRQVLEVHHGGRPDLFKGGVKKYKDEELAAIIADDKRPIFVAVKDGKIQGYAFCVLKQPLSDNILTPIKTLYIDDLCVDENARGKGVGRAVYEYVVEYARLSGCYNITLNVWSCNPGAVKFYEKMGLVPQKIGMEKIIGQ